MSNVLIVDDEKSFVLSIEAGFSALGNRFKILTADNGRKAVEVLESNAVDLVVTDIRMPEMDGFELLLYMSRHFPMVPVIVMSAYASPEMEKKIDSLGAFRILEKPVGLDKLARSIDEGLACSLQRGSMTGISLSSFLQLIEMEEKTCLLEVAAPTRGKGFFYFEQGVLFDALLGDCIGEEAASKMLAWEDVRLDFKGVPEKKIKRRIQAGLISLLIDAARFRDEEPESKGTGLAQSLPLDPKAGGGGDFAPEEEPLWGNGKTAANRPESPVQETGFVLKMEQILRKMVSEMDSVRILSVFDTDGISVAAFSPAYRRADEFAAGMAAIIWETEKSVRSLEEFGEPEAHIIQSSTVWILSVCITEKYRMGLAAGRESSMGSLRLLLNRYVPVIRDFLEEPGERR